MAPVVLELLRRSDEFAVKIAVTGQHREMLDQVLTVFGIVPDYDLNIMTHGASLSQITARAMNGLEPILAADRFDWVVAQGDTSTTFVAALSAFYHKVSFGHVEAGLRTFNKFDPFPEEMNRLLVTRLATKHFAPTSASAANLTAEGVSASDIVVTGNTGIDALLTVASREYDLVDADVTKIAKQTGRVLLVTAHRRENWGPPLIRIAQAVKTLVEKYPDTIAVLPMHRNPVVREALQPVLAGNPRVLLIEPPDYVPFVKLQQKATIILTDSGGVQEEAPSLGKPVLVLRETTERPEGIAAGVALLIGTETSRIVAEASRLLDDPEAYTRMSRAVSPYGDGKASQRIADTLLGK